jgi:hypothetical protein
MWLSGYRDITSPWQIANTTIAVFDIEHSKDARVNLSASGSGTALDITSFDYINIPSGNVGIGSSNATQKLVVNGSAIVYGDFYTVPWTDYSATSTIVGFSTYDVKKIFYKKSGKLVYCWFNIQGNSGSTITGFTLPYTTNSSHDSHIPIAAMNNSVTISTGTVYLAGSTGTFDCYTTFGGALWLSINYKGITGQFFYETA